MTDAQRKNKQLGLALSQAELEEVLLRLARAEALCAQAQHLSTALQPLEQPSPLCNNLLRKDQPTNKPGDSQ